MSSTVPSSVSSALPSSSSSDPAGQSSGFGNTSPALSSSASLYLYTFLATLILLLTISAAIIARSYCVRRRQRQLVEEAIRNGTFIPPPPVRPINLKEKPVLYDVYLSGDGVVSLGGYDDKKRRMSEVESVDSDLKAWQNAAWGKMMPLAAVAEKAEGASSSEEGTRPSTPTRSHHPFHRVWIPRRLRQRRAVPADVPLMTLSDIASPTTPPPITVPESSPNSPPESPGPESVQLALFIAMPNPSRHQESHEHPHLDEEESLPPIEIGFTEVSLRPKGSKSECMEGEEDSGQSS